MSLHSKQQSYWRVWNCMGCSGVYQQYWVCWNIPLHKGSCRKISWNLATGRYEFSRSEIWQESRHYCCLTIFKAIRWFKLSARVFSYKQRLARPASGLGHCLRDQTWLCVYWWCHTPEGVVSPRGGARQHPREFDTNNTHTILFDPDYNMMPPVFPQQPIFCSLKAI